METVTLSGAVFVLNALHFDIRISVLIKPPIFHEEHESSFDHWDIKLCRNAWICSPNNCQLTIKSLILSVLLNCISIFSRPCTITLGYGSVFLFLLYVFEVICIHSRICTEALRNTRAYLMRL